MQLEIFRGKDMRALTAWVQRSLGDDAMIIKTNVLKRPGGDVYEVLAAPPHEVETYRRRLVAAPVSADIASRVGTRPYLIALVGPPGAGKTTATMKLALHPRGVGRRKVGLLTLDTYRVGAVEEIQTYAEIAELPLEVVYHPREVDAALTRLGHLDVVLVDTPGRSAIGSGWVQVLRALAPDEVHLVLPASLRQKVALDLKSRLEPTAPTHALFTKLDEVPGDAGLTTMIETLDLPVRWVGDGYDVPGTLQPASSRIGCAPDQETVHDTSVVYAMG